MTFVTQRSDKTKAALLISSTLRSNEGAGSENERRWRKPTERKRVRLDHEKPNAFPERFQDRLLQNLLG